MKNTMKLISGTSQQNSFCIDNFDSIIGQDNAIQKLRFFVDTHDDETPIPTLLFTGSHGLGKTYVAKKIASIMNRKFVEINCGSIDTIENLIENVFLNQVLGEDEVCLFFDESHQLNNEITTILLTLLNPSEDMKNFISYKNWNIEFDLTKINVIFATTDAYKMFGPLVNRCEKIYFESYSKENLIKMLMLYAGNIKIECDVEDLSDACRGRGRDTFHLAQKINRYFKLQQNYHSKDKILCQKSWNDIKNIFEINPLGLNKQEVQLLKLINKYECISLCNLASIMMVNNQNIESELETRLRELNLIQNSSKGRCLTEKGNQYILKIKK